MSSVNGADAPGRRKASRSSLACLPCRSRHLKCDGKRPQCSRCSDFAKQCHYTESRRGGLDRAALEERRRRLSAAENGHRTSNQPQPPDPRPSSRGRFRHQCQSRPADEHVDIEPQLDDCLNFGFSDIAEVSGSGSDLATSESLSQGSVGIGNDAMIKSYYKNFHKFHPMALPQRHLVRLCEDATISIVFKPLLAVMRLIGNLYSCKQLSSSLRESVDESILRAAQMDPILVQCHLLYSIALFWNDLKAESRHQMDAAVTQALNLGMFKREFAVKNGNGDTFLAESWRRTWWWLYIVDGYYTGTLGTREFALMEVDASAGLPCEEREYESGNIPEPKTMQDFDCREFADGDVSFSSFAYLIAAAKCAASAIASTPKIATKEVSEHLIHAADSAIDGWLLLLPKDRKQVFSKTGEIDELMFQAHLLMHVAIVGLHRPLSDLEFNAVEGVSSCAREPPLKTPIPDLVNVHTVRVLRSIEAQIRLLALPVRPFHHTPFTTCMVSEGTLALLSACNFLLRGKELTVARDQIRMTIGCLKALGEVWPRIARNVQEIQTIARHVLGLERPACRDVSGSTTTSEPSESTTQSLDPESDLSGSSILSAIGIPDSICGWSELGDLDAGLSWWVNDS